MAPRVRLLSTANASNNGRRDRVAYDPSTLSLTVIPTQKRFGFILFLYLDFYSQKKLIYPIWVV